MLRIGHKNRRAWSYFESAGGSLIFADMHPGG